MPLAPIPPPITASIFLPTRSAPSPLQQKPWYHRKAASLESDLQLLLDAQAASLSNPLAPPSPSPSASSTTSLHSSFTKRIPLRSARAGLYTTMRRLAALKDEEVLTVMSNLDSIWASHEQLVTWHEQRTKLRERTEVIARSEDVGRAQELREKAEGLQPEIAELEDRLAKLRNEQRRLRREADELAERVEGKVAGYTRRLEGLEREVKRFLEGLGREDGVMFDSEAEEDGEEEGFWAAPKRRTLDMAVDVVGKERERVEGRLEVVETEKEALLEGAVVWRDVVKLVERFEKELREDMKSIGSDGGSSERLKDMLTRMDEVAEQLESQVKLAEAKGWKLLIAAIGAELDAFLKGKEVLQQALDAIEGPRELPLFDGTDDEDQGVNSVIRSPTATRKDDQASHDGKIEELDQAFERRRPATNGSHDTDEDDDGPDPELMISHHDTDTD